MFISDFSGTTGGSAVVFSTATCVVVVFVVALLSAGVLLFFLSNAGVFDVFVVVVLFTLSVAEVFGSLFAVP